MRLNRLAFWHYHHPASSIFTSRKQTSHTHATPSNMANSGADPASDLQGLFSSLRSNNAKSYASPQSRPVEPRPSTNVISSPALSPSFNTPQSHDYANMRKTLSTASISEQSNAERTASLLNLLKFSAPTSSGQATPQHQSVPASRPPYGTGQSQASSNQNVHNLVASFLDKPSTPVTRENLKPSLDATRAEPTSHQDFLLKLLNRPSPLQETDSTLNQLGSPDSRDQSKNISTLPRDIEATSERPSTAPGPKRTTPFARKESPIRIFGSDDNSQPTPFEPKDVPKFEPQRKKESIFTYVNPFEQLAASSPRNVKPRSEDASPTVRNTNGDGNKRKTNETLPEPTHMNSRRKLTANDNEILRSIESSEPTLLDDGRSKVEALIGIGAPSKDAETVAEALNEVGEQVDQEVEDALARAEAIENEVQIKEEELEEAKEATLDALEDRLREVALDVKQELDREENQGLLEQSMPTPMAEAVKDIIDEAAEGHVAVSSNEEDDRTNDQEDRMVRVYNFPMKPFVSIDIKQPDSPQLQIREDSVMNIARLKKEFDQIDRTLATATNEFIVYGVPKTGGLRIIRQDDGAAQHIFHNSHDRIFNVSISSAVPLSPLRGIQTIIATGVSGSVYWATLSKSTDDLFEAGEIERQGLIFPVHSDSTSGGQLKTRAKKSSRHPEFFAIGRGKSIQIIFPMQARSSKLIDGSTVDTEKYFKDRNLKISTGKAGKDFTFSEDDTVIATLDKAGRVRFWDIRDLVDEANSSATKLAPIEVKSPLLTFVTAPATEKSWPTSVLFVDKLRSYTKGIALRYIIVGMKQNHTLQLWDLGLGKAVQELNFPHENESDAICSIAYHPASSIIVVGHPTRNSIYLIHLSAPRYNLPAMTQTKYVQRLAIKDHSLPKPEATAIMSGMREISFSSKGQLRSIELIPSSGEPTRVMDEDDQDPMLFELYVMHSKGVTCLAIKKEDLGWSKDSKVLHPVDAEAEGVVAIKELRDPQVDHFSEASSINGDILPAPPVPPTTPTARLATKDSNRSTTASVNKSRDAPPKDTVASTAKKERTLLDSGYDASSGNADKSEKKKKRRTGGATEESISHPADPLNVHPVASSAPESYANAAQRARSPISNVPVRSNPETAKPSIAKPSSEDTHEPVASAAATASTRSLANGESINISGEFLNQELKKIEKGFSGEFSKVLNRELESLYRRFDEDKRVQDAAGAAKQDAVLRLVSSTLGDNVEKSLARMIGTSIKEEVLPSIADITASTLDKSVSETINQQLHQAIPPLLKSALPEAVSRAMQNPEILRAISDQITSKVATHVESEFSKVLHSTITPSFKNLAITTAHKISAETERRVGEQLQKTESQHQEDGVKIDQLALLVRGLSETVHAMATAQSEFQQEILRLQRQVAQERQASSSRANSRTHQQNSLSSESPAPRKSPEQEELEAVTALMNEGRYEEGTIQVCVEWWTKSNVNTY